MFLTPVTTNDREMWNQEEEKVQYSLACNSMEIFTDLHYVRSTHTGVRSDVWHMCGNFLDPTIKATAKTV